MTLPTLAKSLKGLAAGLVASALLASPSAFAAKKWDPGEEVRETITYSYVDKDGIRIYTNTKPKGVEYKQTKVTFPVYYPLYPPYLFKCKTGKEEFTSEQAYKGCVIIGGQKSP